MLLLGFETVLAFRLVEYIRLKFLTSRWQWRWCRHDYARSQRRCSRLPTVLVLDLILVWAVSQRQQRSATTLLIGETTAVPPAVPVGGNFSLQTLRSLTKRAVVCCYVFLQATVKLSDQWTAFISPASVCVSWQHHPPYFQPRLLNKTACQLQKVCTGDLLPGWPYSTCALLRAMILDCKLLGRQLTTASDER